MASATDTHRRADITQPPSRYSAAAVGEQRHVPATPHARVPRPEPDWAVVHRERQRPGMTLQPSWIEYKATEPTGYGFTQCCARYHAWADTLEPVLRQLHVPGEKVFVDYAGQTMPVHDVATGTVREAQIFVGAVGASHLQDLARHYDTVILPARAKHPRDKAKVETAVRLTSRPHPSPGDRHQPKRLVAMDRTR